MNLLTPNDSDSYEVCWGVSHIEKHITGVIWTNAPYLCIAELDLYMPEKKTYVTALCSIAYWDVSRDFIYIHPEYVPALCIHIHFRSCSGKAKTLLDIRVT